MSAVHPTSVAPTSDAALTGGDVPFADLEVRGASLEEAFLSLTSRTGATTTPEMAR